MRICSLIFGFLISHFVSFLATAELLDLESTTSEREQTDSSDLRTIPVPPLTSLNFVGNYLLQLQSAREQITDMMEDMVVRGLRDLVSLLSVRKSFPCVGKH